MWDCQGNYSPVLPTVEGGQPPPQSSEKEYCCRMLSNVLLWTRAKEKEILGTLIKGPHNKCIWSVYTILKIFSALPCHQAALSDRKLKILYPSLHSSWVSGVLLLKWLICFCYCLTSAFQFLVLNHLSQKMTTHLDNGRPGTSEVKFLFFVKWVWWLWREKI